MVAAYYDGEEMQMWAMDKLANRAISDVETVDAGDDLPTVSIEDYTPGSQLVELSVFYSGSATLNPNSSQLEKSIFFGKSKDEVRRYVLSLDHVRGVDVELYPVWILSIPSNEDQVTVKVQSK